MICKLVLGSDSYKTETFLIETNKTIDQLHDAYVKSRELTGLSLHAICYDYDDSSIPSHYLETFKMYNLSDEILSNDWIDFSKDHYLVTETFCKLYMWFLTLSLKDLEWKIIDYPVLDEGLGYGLFA